MMTFLEGVSMTMMTYTKGVLRKGLKYAVTVTKHPCYTQRRRDNFPGTQFFLDKFLFSKKGLGQRIPKQLVELKKVSEFFDGSLSPSENRPLGEKTLSSQMLLELNFF